MSAATAHATDWRDDAACLGHDPAIFLTPCGRGVDPVAAMRVCSPCPVRHHCLDEALDEHEPAADLGVFGGTTARHRTSVRSGRMSRAAALKAGDRIAQMRTDDELAELRESRARKARERQRRDAATARRVAAVAPEVAAGERIRNRVVAEHGFTVKQIVSPSRGREVSRCRREVVETLHRDTELTVEAIGELVGRHHTTVLYILRTETR